MRYLVILLGVFFLNGCLARTYTTEKARVDTGIEGNRGYIQGCPKNQKQEIDNKTRKISVLEIELGKHNLRGRDVEQEMKEEQARAQQAQEEVVIKPAEDEYAVKEYSCQDKDKPAAESTCMKEESQTYTIQKNDTLQKISQKFYGTTKKWKMLYDKNSDVLKSPDKIVPGKKIKIPKV